MVFSLAFSYCGQTILSMGPNQKIKAVEQQASEETIFSLDENKVDEQGLVYTLNSRTQTATVSGQEILSEGEIRIPEKVGMDGVKYTVTGISSTALKDCLYVASLVVGDFVTSFSMSSIQNSGCKKLYLGKAVKKIVTSGVLAKKLCEIQVSPLNPYYTAEEGIVYDSSKSTVVCCPQGLILNHTLCLPESVKIIGQYAFWNSLLQSIDLSHVVEIKQAAFNHSALLEADLRNCREIGLWAFETNQLKNVRFRERTELATSSFSYGLNADGIYLPAGMSAVSASGLPGSSSCLIAGANITSSEKVWGSLEQVSIQEGVTVMDRSLIDGRNTVDKIYIPSSVTTFTEDASAQEQQWNGIIYGASGGAAETFASQLGKEFVVHGEEDHQWHHGTYWENDTIHYEGDICEICGHVKNVSVLWGEETEEPERPVDTVSELDESNRDTQGITYELKSGTSNYAMAGDGTAANTCHSQKVVLPDFVKKDGVLYPVTGVNQNAFGDELEQIDLGEWVTSFRADAFLDCFHLSTISISENNTCYTQEDGAVFDKQKTTLCRVNPQRTEKYEFPASVYVIGSYAFYRSQLKDVRLSENISEVSLYAFYESRITTIDLSHVTNIGSSAFRQCSQLRWAILGKNLDRAGGNVFDSCTHLEAVYMPSIVNTTDIDQTPLFGYGGCASLRFSYLLEGMTTLTDTSFRQQLNLEECHIPASVTKLSFGVLDAQKVILHGYKDSVAESTAASQGYSFIPYCEEEHTLEECVISEYEGKSMVGKQCKNCGFLADVHEEITGEEPENPNNTPSATPTATPTTTPSVTPTVTPSATPTATPSATPTATPSTAPTPSETPSVALTRKPTSITPTPKPTVTSTKTTSTVQKKESTYLATTPVITVKKKKKSGVRYLQVKLKKYQGKYIEFYAKVGKKKYKKISSKKITIKKYKGNFKIRIAKKNTTVRIKVRTYTIKSKKKVYSRYSKARKVVV